MIEGWFERWLDETGFLVRYPQYAGVVARMDPIATQAVQTMAVALRRWDDPNARIQLLVNPDYFRSRAQYRGGILLHEIQHVVLGHLTNPKFHVAPHPRLMEIAMELSANESIDAEEVPSGIFLPMFEQFGILPGQSTMERYALLAEAYECGELSMMDYWCSRMLDVHRPRRDGGCAGSGIGDFLDARSDGGSARNWNRRWAILGRGAPTLPHEIERMKLALAAHLRGEKGGSVEDVVTNARLRVAKEIDRVIIQPRGVGHQRLDWRRILREAFPPRRLVHPDYLKPNRRFPARIGEIPGRTRRPPKPTLLVGIDTSGSMSVDTLAPVAREIQMLGRYAKLTIVECDAAVHRMYPLGNSPLGPFLGGGDTDFSPVFDAASAASSKYDGVIYFTDGRGEMPGGGRSSAPIFSPVKALWVITHSDPFDPPFGRVVRFPMSA